VLRLVLVLVLHVLRLVKRHACGVVRRVRDQARRGDGVEIAAEVSLKLRVFHLLKVD
jgi:hypothetical protein